MVFLKRKIPKATISIEIDTNYSGIIMLDNKETFVEPKVSELILNMIEQRHQRRNQTNDIRQT